MISAARLIAHKAVNGRYQSRLQMDKFPVIGHQMTVGHHDGRGKRAKVPGDSPFLALDRLVHHKQC